MKSRAAFSLPPFSSPYCQAARYTQRAAPEVFGFAGTTDTPGFTRSLQSLIPFGFPLRTRNTIVEV